MIVLVSLVSGHLLVRRGVSGLQESGVALILGLIVGLLINFTKSEEPYERELLFNVGCKQLNDLFLRCLIDWLVGWLVGWLID